MTSLRLKWAAARGKKTLWASHHLVNPVSVFDKYRHKKATG